MSVVLNGVDPFHLVFAEEGARQLAHLLQGHLERWRLSGIVGPMA